MTYATQPRPEWSNPNAPIPFDMLPDDARVREAQVRQMLGGFSRVTLWRWVKAGKLPKGTKVGGMTSWRLGDLRKLLAAIEAGAVQ